jgi:GTP cyclohydrolase I
VSFRDEDNSTITLTPVPLVEPTPLTDGTRRERGTGLRVVGKTESIDIDGAERAVRDLLVALGRDPSSEHLAGTPRRVAGALAEMLTPEPFELTTFLNDEEVDQLVVVRGIAFHSLCEHHLLPFSGLAHVGYLPDKRIVGLSKLARVVEKFARDLQTQERLTSQVADWLDHHLQPRGVGVVMEADHMCMSLRGVRSTGARTVTSAVHGVIRHDPRSRDEFFALTAVHR